MSDRNRESVTRFYETTTATGSPSTGPHGRGSCVACGHDTSNRQVICGTERFVCGHPCDKTAEEQALAISSETWH